MIDCILCLLSWGTIAMLVVAFLGFYFTRSSKSMPKSFSELKSEIYWQYHGIRGLVEDAVLKKNNRVGEWNILIFSIAIEMINKFL